MEPITASIGLAVIYYLTGRNNKKAAEINRNSQQDIAKENRKHTERMQQRNEETQWELHKDSLKNRKEEINYSIQEQKRSGIHPFNSPIEYIENNVPYDALRCFIVPPRHLTLRGAYNDQSWNDVHSNELSENIRSFVQSYFNAYSSPRPVYLYDPDILNPKGLRGESAYRVLQTELSHHPYMWLEANRINEQSCSLGMATWNSNYASGGFSSLGRIPNYAIAKKRAESQNVALSILFRKQTEQLHSGSKLSEILKEQQLIGDKSPLYQLFQTNELLNLKKVFAEENIQQPIENTHSTSIHNSAIETQAINYLAEAYKMQIAVNADLHYLNFGIAPLLPQLIKEGIFDVENQYIQGATGQVLAHYLIASSALASNIPEMAPEIWLGMAECVVKSRGKEETKNFILESVKCLADNNQITKPERIDDIPRIMKQMPPNQPSCIEYIQRLKDILDNVGLELLTNNIDVANNEAESNEKLRDVLRVAGKSIANEF